MSSLLSSNNFWFFLLVTNVVLSIIIFSIIIKKNGFQDAFFKFIVMLFLPVFGFLFFVITYFLKKISKKSDDNIESYLNYIHGKGYIYYEEPIDFESEINTIPIQDSLMFSDDKTKRSYLIYLLKKDFSSHINGLKNAIKSTDSETSHYAAAALMEIKKQYEFLLQTAKENYELEKSLNNAKHYAEVLKKYLRSKIADKLDYYDFLGKYSDLLEEILQKDKSEEEYFIEKVRTDIELADFKNAYKYCKLYLESFNNSQTPYILLLKIFYNLKDKVSFEKTLKDLKEKIGKTISNQKVIDIINFWEGIENT